MTIAHDLPPRASVVIIGGGFAGAATAYELARAGVEDIVLVEREATCGYHASGRNAALGRQLVEDDAFTELTVQGCAFLRSPPDGFSDRSLLAMHGSVLLADTGDEVAAMAARASHWKLPHEIVTASALARRWPVLARVPAAGGVHFATDGVIDVHELLSSYLRRARANGVTVAVNCEVTGFCDCGDRALVATRRGAIATPCVVLAAGAWVGPLGSLAGSEPVHFAPIRRHLFVTEVVPDLDRRAPFVWHVGACEFYLRPEGKGYLLSGCDETEVEPCDAVPAPGALEALAARLSPIAPRLTELGIARTWACLRTFAPDRRPVIGWDQKRSWLFWVAALGGHGATASAAIGRVAAGQIVSRLQ